MRSLHNALFIAGLFLSVIFIVGCPAANNGPSAPTAPSPANTFTPTASLTASFTRTDSTTPTPSATLTSTPSDTATNSPTRTATLTPTNTATMTFTNTATHSPTNSATPTPTNTATATPTFTTTNSPTNTATFTPTNTATNSYTPTVTNTATNSATNSPTDTATPTPTDTPTDTATNSPTDTATSTPTNSATSSPTDTPTYTPSNTPTDTSTDTPTLTSTFTKTFTPTQTFTSTQTSSCSGFASSVGSLASNDHGSGTATLAAKVHLSQNSWIKQIRVAGNDFTICDLEAAVYRDDGSGTKPGTLLTLSTSGTQTLNGAVTLAFDIPDTLVVPGDYWVAFYKHSGGFFPVQFGPGNPTVTLAFSGFPSDGSGSFGDPGFDFPAALDYCSSDPTFTPTKTSTSTPTWTPTNTPTNTPTDTMTPTITPTPCSSFTAFGNQAIISNGQGTTDTFHYGIFNLTGTHTLWDIQANINTRNHPASLQAAVINADNGIVVSTSSVTLITNNAYQWVTFQLPAPRTLNSANYAIGLYFVNTDPSGVDFTYDTSGANYHLNGDFHGFTSTYNTSGDPVFSNIPNIFADICP